MTTRHSAESSARHKRRPAPSLEFFAASYEKRECGLCGLGIRPSNLARHIDVHLRTMTADEYRHLGQSAREWLFERGYRV